MAKYHRLFDKVKRYEKYRDSHALDCGLGKEKPIACYSGKRVPGDYVFVVFPENYAQAKIADRKGDIIRYELTTTDASVDNPL